MSVISATIAERVYEAYRQGRIRAGINVPSWSYLSDAKCQGWIQAMDHQITGEIIEYLETIE